eukprot:57745_1
MSTEPETNQKWKQPLSFPSRSYISQPLFVNTDEFMVVASKGFEICDDADGIYKFDTQKNEWTKIFHYDKNFKCTVDSAAYDYKHKLLYICDLSQYPSIRMSTFDLQTRNKETSMTEEQGIGYCGLIFVEDKLHKIYSRNGDHYIYDKTKEFQKITTFKSLEYLVYYCFIYLQSQKSILLFGGYKLGGAQNSIYRFSCIDSKWKALNIKMPMESSQFGLVSTENEKHIII